MGLEENEGGIPLSSPQTAEERGETPKFSTFAPLPTILDGNTAVSRVAHLLSEEAFLYPITPSTPASDELDKLAIRGVKNIWGRSVRTFEMQSELGVSGSFHGGLVSGALCSAFTSSQGLLLMLPTMYRIAGDLLPGVIHVASRALSIHNSDIFCDMSDVMAVRSSGFCMLHSSNVQEAQDMAVISHLSAWRCYLPFLHWYDGFRTSHEIATIDSLTEGAIRELITAGGDKNPYQRSISNFRKLSQNPNHPWARGSIGNHHTYWQGLQRNTPFYDDAPTKVQNAMDDFAKVSGRQYHLFDYFGHPEAEDVVIMMGSGVGPAREAVEKLTKEGEKVGVVVCRLYRPFSIAHFLESLPPTVKRICVLDKIRDLASSTGEPLYLDVCAALARQVDASRDESDGHKLPDLGQLYRVINGLYGVGGRDIVPGDFMTILEHLRSENPIRRFSIGLVDDYTKSSISPSPLIESRVKETSLPEGTVECLVYGMGSDGTVGANKGAIKTIGHLPGQYAQGFFSYTAKKAGGVTTSHLRFGPKPLVTSSYFVQEADYIGVHQPPYLWKINVAKKLKKGGIVVLNSPHSLETLDAIMPARFKRQIAEKGGKVYVIDAAKVAQAVGLGGTRISNVMQTVFWKLANVMPEDEAFESFREAIRRQFRGKPQEITDKNLACIDLSLDEVKLMEYDRELWLKAKDESDPPIVSEGELPTHMDKKIGLDVDPALGGADMVTSDVEVAPVTGFSVPQTIHQSHMLHSDGIIETLMSMPGSEVRRKWIHNVLKPFNTTEGADIPVSAFLPGGLQPTATTQAEKRGIAVNIPIWNPKKCIQCMSCLGVCPHAVLRPVVAESKAQLVQLKAPKSFETAKLRLKKGRGKETYPQAQFRIQVSSRDCTGCGVCIESCPADALKFEPFIDVGDQEHKNYMWYLDQPISFPNKNKLLKDIREGRIFKHTTPKALAFQSPMHEFSGACAGCGHSGTLRMLTQMFGSSLNLAVVTGCSSVYSIPFPSAAIGVDRETGRGPSFARSLFENNAEFGFGMAMTTDYFHSFLKENIKDSIPSIVTDRDIPTRLVTSLRSFVDVADKTYESRIVSDQIMCQLHLLKSKRPDVFQRHPCFKNIDELQDYLPKISNWIVMGDGAAYDIGSAGVDHVLGSGRDVNILVLNNQVYANTGGQASKATPRGATAMFAQKGKSGDTKDLGMQAITYGGCYVASIALGADQQQAMKAMREAEAFPGPSIVIGFCPCIAWHLRGGLKESLTAEKLGVETGFWPLYRFNPEKRDRGEPPCSLDSEPPKFDNLNKFLSMQGRFSEARKDKAMYEALMSHLKDNVQKRYHVLELLSKETQYM
eukprot:gnl/Carplike_NY0171/332_a457_1846.p1 GENE.gnl/Carplike_NY0171/332_a457_1846~~gnl/Carplike_NY0171/332_a457_1846.p1  ORF type:complete len:1338 (+),score=461.28 gnl/Carplike_NY0171/332_a457_1846:97-4110(+)